MSLQNRGRGITTLLKVFMTALLVMFSWPVAADESKEILIYGGQGHKQFLGCLICSELSSDSICNGFATFGNEFSSDGMFNEFSGFGNEFNSSSPWNEFSLSNSVPILVDRDANFYGYFTVNDSRSDAVEFASDLNKYFKYAKGDLEVVRKLLCQRFGYSG